MYVPPSLDEYCLFVDKVNDFEFRWVFDLVCVCNFLSNFIYHERTWIAKVAKVLDMWINQLKMSLNEK